MHQLKDMSHGREISKDNNKNTIFTALHVMQTRSSDENSVRLSVRHTREL